MRPDPAWVAEAVRRIEADFVRSADTHLIRLELPAAWGIDLYLKDESTHPTGSLKHRLARSLFLYGLCNGWIGPKTTIVEASSGSTAISEAYFARLLGLPFIAVVPAATSPTKLAEIRFAGGACELVTEGDVYGTAARLARECSGHYMDQFTMAERATDWRGNNNIAESIFAQLAAERFPEPLWIVVGAGTGGTSATIGRYLRYRRLTRTRLCVADPERSAFHDFWHHGAHPTAPLPPSRIEGIGRPRVEPSFLPAVVDRLEQVPDAASMAALRVLERRLGRRVGGSTGTNLVAVCRLVAELRRAGHEGSIVSLICDSGERYLASYYDAAWLTRAGLDPAPWEEALERLMAEGVLVEPC